MRSYLLGALSAIFLGMLTEWVNGGLSRVLKRARLSRGSRRVAAFDVRQDGLFMLAEWSPARVLRPENLISVVLQQCDRPPQTWVSEELFAKAVEESSAASGDIVYLTNVRIDHRESEETQYCRVYLAESVYPEVLAIERIRIEHPEVLVACDTVLDVDPTVYLRSAIPSSIAVNLVIVSPDSNLLCTDRSNAVDSGVGWWTVGVFEMMKRSDPDRPGSEEDLFSLAERGLKEELGLRGPEVGTIYITWLGILRPILRGHVVAVVFPDIDEATLIERAKTAHSGYEHAKLDWIPLNRPLVNEVLKASLDEHYNKVGNTFELRDRTFIEQSRLAVLEAWRFRSLGRWSRT